MAPRERKSIYELQDAYDRAASKDKGSTELGKVIKAFRALKASTDETKPSWFKIASIHGAPFKGAGWGNSQWWGGYCHHGNILFPTWHRAYVLEIEKALHSHGLDTSIGIPYWDELDLRASSQGLPHIFTDETVDVSEAEPIPNPLQSFTLPNNINDNATPPPLNYAKPIGYTTVRYPYSGLVGTKEAREETEGHNEYIVKKAFAEGVKDVDFLNRNIKYWYTYGRGSGDKGVGQKYRECLKVKNYTLFSNSTSAKEYNQQNYGSKGFTPVVSLESPHNDMHLAIGGIDIPGYQYGLIEGANGDMGENDTSAFDPIFAFHHAFIDKVFWDWQVEQKTTDKLTIIEEYPGTNSVDNQGPTPGVQGNVWLNLDTELKPFKKDTGKFYTSNDVTNITKLGYSYKKTEAVAPTPEKPPGIVLPGRRIIPHRSKLEEHKESPLAAGVIKIHGINRSSYRGSFAVVVQVKVKYEDDKEDDKEEWIVVDVEGILSRWNVAGCANCQTHLNVTTFTNLPQGAFSKQFLAEKQEAEKLDRYISVWVRHHEDDKDSKGRRPHAKKPPTYAPNPGLYKDILEYHGHWDLVWDD